MQRNDPGFLPQIRQSLYTAVLSDVLDELGFRDQAMPPSIRPLDENLTLAGFARTGLYREVFRIVPDENPYELEIALVDDLKPDEVAVFGAPARVASRLGESCCRPHPGHAAQPGA